MIFAQVLFASVFTYFNIHTVEPDVNKNYWKLKFIFSVLYCIIHIWTFHSMWDWREKKRWKVEFFFFWTHDHTHFIQHSAFLWVYRYSLLKETHTQNVFRKKGNLIESFWSECCFFFPIFSFSPLFSFFFKSNKS